MRILWLCLACLLVMALAVAAQTLDEVPPRHWTYAAIDALTQHGLVHGYAAAPYGGPTPLTRAEMAALTARAVRGVGEAMRERGRRLELLAQAPLEGAPLAAAEEPSAAPPAVTPEDLARIDKLLAEFRNELVTMGAKVDNIAAELADLRTSLDEARNQVEKVTGEVMRHRLSGYAQMRYTVDGSAAPASEFAVGRAKLTMSGPVSKRVDYKVDLDVPAQKKAGESTVILSQGYAALDFNAVRVLAGQFYVPFGWEMFTSTRDLEAPEESLGVKRLFPDRNYDRGVRVEGGLGDKWRGWLALVNGTGHKRGDTNDHKDVAVRLARADQSLEYGLSAYYGEDTSPATLTTARADAQRRLAGAHLVARRGPAELKGEIIVGKAALADAIAGGDKDVLAWTVLGGYAPRPGTRLAIRWHRFDPDRDAAGDSTDVTSLMWMRQLDPTVRLRVAGDFVRPDAGGSYDIFTTELQITY